MFEKRRIISYLLVLTLLLVSAHKVCAAEHATEHIESSSIPADVKRVVLLPITNYTENPKAGNIITEAIKKELLGKGYFVVDADLVEDFLAKRRIRDTNVVSRLTAREMGKVLGADAVLVGSADLFSSEGDNEVTVGVTARLVCTMDGGILWAEHLSSSGLDYEGLLGLGAIKSIDTLTSMVTKSLVRSVPEVASRGSALRPFETAGMNVSPAKARHGDKISLSVKMVPITGDPVLVKAVIGGKEVSLAGNGSGNYVGVLDAPDIEGNYPVDVIAYDQDMRPFSFRSCGKVCIHNTPPQVAIMLDKKILAPKRKNYVKITPVLKDIEDIDDWKIEILDSEGKLVRDGNGYGKLPKKLIWKGEANNASLVPDGEYKVRFTVKNVDGNQTVLNDTVKVKNTPPAIKVAVSLVDEMLILTFNTAAKDEVIDEWKVSILDDKGAPLGTFNGEGEIPHKLEYPVKEGIDLNNISFLVTATDDAGNPFEFKNSLKNMPLKKSTFAKMNGNERVLDDF